MVQLTDPNQYPPPIISHFTKEGQSCRWKAIDILILKVANMLVIVWKVYGLNRAAQAGTSQKEKNKDCITTQ